jgi:hypothetical protein
MDKNKAGIWLHISRLLSVLANITQRGYRVEITIRMGCVYSANELKFCIYDKDEHIYPPGNEHKGHQVERCIFIDKFAGLRQSVDDEILALNELFFPKLVQINVSEFGGREGGAK